MTPTNCRWLGRDGVARRARRAARRSRADLRGPGAFGGPFEGVRGGPRAPACWQSVAVSAGLPGSPWCRAPLLEAMHARTYGQAPTPTACRWVLY
jgi:hypothetical protein